MQCATLVLQLDSCFIGLLVHHSPASPVLFSRTLHTHPGVLIGRGLGNQHRDNADAIFGSKSPQRGVWSSPALTSQRSKGSSEPCRRIASPAINLSNLS